MEEEAIVGFIFFVLGGLIFTRPDIFLRFQVWSQKTVLGATYSPSKRTETILRFMGVLFILIGLASLTGFFDKNKEYKEKSSFDELTFCEQLIEMKRLVSSSMIVPGLDVGPEDNFYGSVASADFEGKYPEASQFRTRIGEVLADGPNFAGHYTVATWGCGSNCQSYAVVDAITGEIVSYGLGSEYGAEFSTNSKLLILNPKENFPTLEESGMSPHQASETFARIPREYYLLRQDDITKESFLTLYCTESAAAHYIKVFRIKLLNFRNTIFCGN